MKQPKFMSLVESVLNIAIGFGISLGAQIYFLPLLGVEISLRQNLMFALIMTAISIARSFLVRRLFEALHIRVPLSAALLAIAAERQRQKDVEGYDAAHDDKHSVTELAAAGAAYAINPGMPRLPPDCWPWDDVFWKPGDLRRDLVRGGALFVAALDRLERMRKRVPPKVAAVWPQR
ncbi:MAG TPA: hypothetical protein VIH40_13515 [Xanthobacteraceae bacterium]